MCLLVFVCICKCMQPRVLRWRMESRKLMGCKSLVRHITQFLLPSVSLERPSGYSHPPVIIFKSYLFFQPYLLPSCFSSHSDSVCLCVCVLSRFIINCSGQDVSSPHCFSASFQGPLKFKSAALKDFLSCSN